jgi:hypothetical protein
MITAYRLYTGPDGDSHVERGSVSCNDLVQAESILFKETPAHSSLDWHNDPVPLQAERKTMAASQHHGSTDCRHGSPERVRHLGKPFSKLPSCSFSTSR